MKHLQAAVSSNPNVDCAADPTYLAADLRTRLQSGEARFRFCVQLRTDPATMPLDEATVRWSASASPPIHVADLILPQQDILARGQAEYGENLAWNIWRVTEEHRPAGSIAEARRVVYAASAEQRRNVNGAPTGEPSDPKPALNPAPGVDAKIVRAAIHPAIGIARIGDSKSGFFIGPEVTDPAPQNNQFYRDTAGALKRQAARFRIYGYNAEGQVVRELTADNADIQWTAHLANRKAQWYQFQAALDIPEATAMTVPRRNARFPDRSKLAIDPGPRTISGVSVSGGADHTFDTGTFKGVTVVPLGEIQTDEAGRLLVLGGTGTSASPSGAPVFNPNDANSFNNADDWYDDTSDGPVTATVSINGEAVPVEAAWVVVAPPNYAPNVVSWRTLYDLLVDVYIRCGWMAIPEKISFTNDILPILRRLSNLQWVNQGFAAMYGKGCPMDFESDAFITKLATRPDPVTKADPYAELRQAIYNSFRPPQPTVSEPVVWPHVWPWIYGDAFGSFPANGPGNMLTMTGTQATLLRRWVEGEVEIDWPSAPPPDSLDKVPPAQRPAMLDKSALHFCLADTFHPGCEVTWPMRHASMYSKPFRIRHRPAGVPEPDYGDKLDQQIALQVDGPLYAQSAGDITRWMALPWQGDTAFCRSGYDPQYDLYVPTFWAARVPNQVLTEEDYLKVINTALPREERIAAFNHRAPWLRAIDGPVIANVMMRMIAEFGALGIVEVRDGVKNDPDFPETMFVETLGASHLRAVAMEVSRMRASPPRPLTRIERAGWSSEEQFREFRRVRVRHE